jgi:hypothetical protein
MTVPEENRPKTHTTDDVLKNRDTADTEQQGESRTPVEALEEAGVTPESVDGEDAEAARSGSSDSSAAGDEDAGAKDGDGSAR